MMRVAHATHAWNLSTQECRGCGCSASGPAALEACASPRAPRKGASSAPTQETLNRAVAAFGDGKRGP